MAQERIVEETPFPPYFDRFIEERDRRLIAELGRLEARIQNNAVRIDDLRQDVERRFAELRQEMERRFDEVERRFSEAADDRRAIRSEITRLDSKLDTHFRWTIGLFIPIVLGILAIIIRVFFFGPIP